MMNKLSILLLLIISPWATVLCDCQLKENARDLLYVGYSNYFTADGNLNYTDIDKIEVRLKEEKVTHDLTKLIFSGSFGRDFKAGNQQKNGSSWIEGDY